uniref:DUF4283 domain-containing protein n=1 Tax=Cannabis sativa TaxID=3483 RepID=A0A803PBF0_CANSA
MSPRESLKSIQQQEDISRDFTFFLNSNRQCSQAVLKGSSPFPPVLRSDLVKKNLASAFNLNEQGSKVKIHMEDIEEEVSSWTPSIVCYVLGANPPLSILDGFVRRIWGDKVHKVGMLAYGIFLIRFQSIEFRDEVLSGGYIFFNSYHQ